MKRVWLIGGTLLATMAIAGAGLADEAESAGETAAEKSGSILSITFENDVFANTDRDYTNGIRVGYLTPANTPDAVLGLAKRNLGFLFDTGANWYLNLAAGQNLYTPADISLPVPPGNDRPYAAFLYGSVGLIVASERRLEALALDIGVVGPSALGEETQSFVHEVLGVQDPKGWDFQLRDEIGVRLLYERKWRFDLFDVDGLPLKVDAIPSASFALGNVDTSAALGATFRVGDRLSDTFGLPRIRPAIGGPGFFDKSGGLGWYIFAGAEARAVGYTMFVEGNFFRDGGPGLEPERLVGDGQLGAVLQFGRWELSYTHVFRSAEYEGQDDDVTQFGSLNLRVQF